MFIISICSCITLVMVLAFCLCWKKKTQKNEWLGPDGMITQKNPDENVNHLQSAASHCVVDSVIVASGDSDPNKSRTSTINNPRRKLPEIPSEGQAEIAGDNVGWTEPNGDNSSELYATVDDQNQAKRHVVLSGIESKSNISQHNFVSQADDAFSPYAQVTYNDLRKEKHRYARVQPPCGENSTEVATASRSDNQNLLLQVSDPVAPPRSRRSSEHSSGVDIPAASAVAGGIAANQELPYMTPPIAQTNFSGDSQDSSKGYTSISVREPLANIIAQTKGINKMKSDLDPHYSTVSDDSDDVYTTIPDPNNPIYTSESETYARIPALPITVEAEVNAVPAGCEEVDEVNDRLYEPAPVAPHPPSVDSLRQVAHSHSRQASSSSSVANLGSPKPEKRQANSPLPPPPAGSPELHIPKNLDDMYAKVHKNKKRNDKENSDGDKKVQDETSNRKSTSSLNSFEEKKLSETEIKETSKLQRPKREHNYETLKKSPRKCSDPGYEKIKNDEENSEPGYASINGPDSIINSDPGYEVLKQQAASDSDPNYEELHHRTNSDCGECDGNISDQTNLNTTNDGYSTINKQKKNDNSSRNSNSDPSDPREVSLDEPNYESMPSESLSEHNYAILKSNGSESDPNYESVNQNEPNYESVKYLDAALELPYECLNDEDSSRTDSDLPGYEKINVKNDNSGGYESVEVETSGSSNGSAAKVKQNEPPYERLHNETDSETSPYEKIKNKDGYEKICPVNKTSEDKKVECKDVQENVDPGYETIKNSAESNGELLDPDTIFEV